MLVDSIYIRPTAGTSAENSRRKDAKRSGKDAVRKVQPRRENQKLPEGEREQSQGTVSRYA